MIFRISIPPADTIYDPGFRRHEVPIYREDSDDRRGYDRCKRVLGENPERAEGLPRDEKAVLPSFLFPQ